MEIVGGLNADDQAILNPSDSLVTGTLFTSLMRCCQEMSNEITCSKKTSLCCVWVERAFRPASQVPILEVPALAVLCSAPEEISLPLLDAGLKACSTRWLLPLLVVGVLSFAGCVVGPKYKIPTAPVPSAYKEMGDWRTAQPSDQNLGGNWWELFRDPQLNALEQQINVSNQNIKAAVAQYQQARRCCATIAPTTIPPLPRVRRPAGIAIPTTVRRRARFSTASPTTISPYQFSCPTRQMPSGA